MKDHMRITEMDTLFAYNWWATSRVLEAARDIPDDEFTRSDILPVPHLSLRGTLVHMLNLERSTRHRLSRNAAVEPFDETSFTSIDMLNRSWRAEATAMKDYLIGLEDEHMDSVISVSDGERHPYWQVLMHTFNHSTQHRSEAAVLLSALDRSPDDLDFSRFLKEMRT
jgi:uncharacterized damage-inducible protein DinB